jgi:hypothetical protein
MSIGDKNNQFEFEIGYARYDDTPQKSKAEMGVVEYFKNRMDKHLKLNDESSFSGVQKLKTMALAILVGPTMALKAMEKIHPIIPYVPLSAPVALIGGAIYGVIHVRNQLAKAQSRVHTPFGKITGAEDSHSLEKSLKKIGQSSSASKITVVQDSDDEDVEDDEEEVGIRTPPRSSKELFVEEDWDNSRLQTSSDDDISVDADVFVEAPPVSIKDAADELRKINDKTLPMKTYDTVKHQITEFVKHSKITPQDQSVLKDIRRYAQNLGDFKFAGFVAQHDGSKFNSASFDMKLRNLDDMLKTQEEKSGIHRSAIQLKDEYGAFLNVTQKFNLNRIINSTKPKAV